MTPPDNRNPKWNYEPCQAQYGMATIAEAEKPTYWYADRAGERVKVLKVIYAATEFILYDGDGSATEKVLHRGGGPDSGHKSLDIVDGSFEADGEVFGRQALKRERNDYSRPKGPRHTKAKKRRNKKRK